jgi:hypothetical protein
MPILLASALIGSEIAFEITSLEPPPAVFGLKA